MIEGCTTGTVYGTASDLVWHDFAGGSNELSGSLQTVGFDDVQFAACEMNATPEPESFFGSSTAAWLEWSTAGAKLTEETPGGLDASGYQWLSVRFGQVAEPMSSASQSAETFEMFTLDDSMTSRQIPLEAEFARTPPVYDFRYTIASFETISQWAAVRVPLGCIFGPDGVANGDSLRALEIAFADGDGWVVVDDLVFQR